MKMSILNTIAAFCLMVALSSSALAACPARGGGCGDKPDDATQVSQHQKEKDADCDKDKDKGAECDKNDQAKRGCGSAKRGGCARK